MKLTNKNIKLTLFIIAGYLLIILFRGFNYATGDVVDVMSYTRYLQDNQLFRFDFYVQNISKVIPNERYFFSFLLSKMGTLIKFLPFVFHSILLVIFLLYLYKIISIYLKSLSLKFIMILLLLGPFYSYNLGGNELYYNMFIASFTAKVFGVVSLFYHLKKARTLPYLLLIISTAIHPTVGIQLFIIFAVIDVFELAKDHMNFSIGKLLGPAFYLMTAGIYIYILLIRANSGEIFGNQYMEIFEFRNAHHFFPQYFSVSSYAVEITLYCTGIFIMIRKKMYDLIKISTVIIIGLIFYTIGVVILKTDMILNTQWFKTTIWLELLAFIAIFSFVEYLWLKLPQKYTDRTILGIFFLIISVSVLLINTGADYFSTKPYRLFYGMKMSNEEDIGMKIKALTEKDAIIIYPVDFTGFKVYSERSAYIDYKSVVHRKDALGEWYSRISEVYGIDINDRRSGQDLFSIANKNFKSLSINKLKELKGKGVNYMVQDKEVDFYLPVLVENKKFKVYILK